jgi:hypothetical protein
VKQVRGWHEYFRGFRVNCESIPRLPAWTVRWALDDPRQLPYLLVWQWMDAGPIKEALRVSRASLVKGVLLKRVDGSSQIVGIARRPLPQNGGSAFFLICPSCRVPRRYLYGWSVSLRRVVQSLWKCRACAGLRYRSEGTYISPWLRHLGGYPRTPPWDPWAFSHPLRLAETGFLESGS